MDQGERKKEEWVFFPKPKEMQHSAADLKSPCCSLEKRSTNKSLLCQLHPAGNVTALFKGDKAFVVFVPSKGPLTKIKENNHILLRGSTRSKVGVSPQEYGWSCHLSNHRTIHTGSYSERHHLVKK